MKTEIVHIDSGQKNVKAVCTNLWSMETRLRSSLCLLLNMTSLCGISSKDGGPNGVHSANKPNGGGSSDLRFWPWITFIRPRTSSLCVKRKPIFIFLSVRLMYERLCTQTMTKLQYCSKNNFLTTTYCSITCAFVIRYYIKCYIYTHIVW